MAKDRQSSEIFEAQQNKFNFKKMPGPWWITSHLCPRFEVVQEIINVIFKKISCFHERYD